MEHTQHQQMSWTVQTPPQLDQQPIQPISPPAPRLAHAWPVWPIQHVPAAQLPAAQVPAAQVPTAQVPVPNGQQYLNPINHLAMNHPAMPQSQLLPPPMQPPPQQLYFTIWLRPGSQAAVGNITVPGNTTVYDLLRNHCPHGRPYFWDASHQRQCVPEHSKTVESLVQDAGGQEHVYLLIEG
ncbi:hypothetical protein LTR17_024288 [Elasticomyces elasticus]|nr:hypothetical protein LTR17_024288 [Elasticomyces elasticus]